MFILLIVIALIVQGSLYPWSFDFGPARQHPFLLLLHSWPQDPDDFTIVDALVNTILYFPLGVAAYLPLARRFPRAAAASMTLCLGLALSVAMELAQAFAPTRVSSLLDVASNTAGTALGLFGAMLSHRYLETVAGLLAQTFRKYFAASGTLLLICFIVYQLFPFTPQIRWGGVAFELHFLSHPDNFFPAEVWANIAEWFTVALILRLQTGRMRLLWIVAAVAFRICIRPFVLTRGFALDELAGAMLAVLLWFSLRDRWRLRAGVALMGSAILLRLLSPLPFSYLPWYMGPGGVAFRSAFDYGAMVWMLIALGCSSWKAGALVVSSLALIVAMQTLLPGHSLSLSAPALALLMTVALQVSESQKPMLR